MSIIRGGLARRLDLGLVYSYILRLASCQPVKDALAEITSSGSYLLYFCRRPTSMHYVEHTEFPFIPYMVALSVLKASSMAKPGVKGWEGSIFIFIVIEYYNVTQKKM